MDAQNTSLNLADLDVDALEERLETSLLAHPFLYDCQTNSEKCNGNVVVSPAPELVGH